MIKIKGGLFDRIEQVFGLLKKTILELMIPVMIYKGCGTLLFMFFFGAIGWSLSSLEGLELEQIVGALLTGRTVGIIFLCIILLLVYLLVGLIVSVGLMGGIKKISAGETDLKIEGKNYIHYGKENFGNACNVYWYMFQYVYLIPLIVFTALIIGIFVLLQSGNAQEYGLIVGLTSSGIILFFLFSMVYRSLQSMFGLYNAVETDDFSKESFNKSITYSKNQLRRIWINTFVLGAILGGLINMVMSFVTSFFAITGSNLSYEKIASEIQKGNITSEQINEIVSDIFSIDIYFILNNALSIVSNSFYLVVYMTFVYIFYLRLRREQEYSAKQSIKSSEL